MPAVSTLGEALAYGWTFRVQCAFGRRDGTKSVRPCVYSAELDVETLVWTRGLDFSLDTLGQRMKCPKCGARRVRIVYEAPKSPVRIVESKQRSRAAAGERLQAQGVGTELGSCLGHAGSSGSMHYGVSFFTLLTARLTAALG